MRSKDRIRYLETTHKNDLFVMFKLREKHIVNTCFDMITTNLEQVPGH